MSTYSALRGPAPKPASQRRRRTKPESYGAAEPTAADQADEQPPLGFDAHELVAGLWAMLVLFGRGPVLLGGGLAACAMGVVVRQHGDDCWPSSAVWTSCLSVRR